MEITEIECKILRIKAGAILILGMQLGSELQLDTEEKREDVLMQRWLCSGLSKKPNIPQILHLNISVIRNKNGSFTRRLLTT